MPRYSVPAYLCVATTLAWVVPTGSAAPQAERLADEAAAAVEVRSEPPADEASRAAVALYTELSASPEVQAQTPAEERAFFRDWHDRLRAVAAGDPAGINRSEALREASTLAAALGDWAAAADAAETWAASAADLGDRAAAILLAARYRGRAVGDDATPGELRAVAQLRQDALDEFETIPPEDRGGFSDLVAIDLAESLAETRERLGDAAGAADARTRAARLEQNTWIRAAVTGTGPGMMLAIVDGNAGRVGLLERQAVAEVDAGRAGAAETVAELAGLRKVPPSLAALQVGRRAKLGGAGGAFLRQYLTDAGADSARPIVLWELAASLAAKGRGGDAIPLLIELRTDHAEAMAALSEGDPRHAPHATSLGVLAQLLQDAGLDDEARDVAAEVDRRYPGTPQYVRLTGGAGFGRLPADAYDRLRDAGDESGVPSAAP